MLLLVALLTACTTADPADTPPGSRIAGPIGTPDGPWREQFHWLPVTEASGAARLILARVCWPSGAALHRLALINHGKSPSAADRAALRPAACTAQAVRWFLARDFVVVLPLRRGYGSTGGRLAEAYPACSASRDYAAGALETARDMQAAITYATALPGVRRDAVVVVGQSAGGLGTIALSSLNDPRIAGLVNMAGGDGGRLNNFANTVCQPPALVRAAGQFGARGRTPMLWIYTANDSYFAPALAAAMHQAYVAGGAAATLRQVPAFGADGHSLFLGAGGSAVWGPLVERFVVPRATEITALYHPR